LLLAGAAGAQDLEPRSFSQAPVGMNFAVLSLGYADGDLLFDQAVPLEDVLGEITSATAIYVRTLGIFGASAKAAVIAPYMWGDWSGLYLGEPASTSRRGFGDPKLDLSVNFVGAPAMAMSEMRSYNQRTVIGASLRVSLPLGQYDSAKLMNLGTNRWGFRPRLGLSHRVGRFFLEAMGSVWLFTDNHDFFGGSHVNQDPLYSIQVNAIYQGKSGLWYGLGTGFSRGGQTIADGVAGDTYKKTTRWAAIVSVPVSKRHSVKAFYVNDLSARVGTSFNYYNLAWSFRWGGER